MCRMSIYFKFKANLYSGNEFKEEEENKRTIINSKFKILLNSNIFFKNYNELVKPISNKILFMKLYSNMLVVRELAND